MASDRDDRERSFVKLITISHEVEHYHIMPEIFYLGSRSHHNNVSMNGHREI